MRADDAAVRRATEGLVDRGRRPLRRLLRDRLAVLGLAVIAAVVLAAVLAPRLADGDPSQTDFGNRFAGPSLRHPLGTDDVGRDELSRILFGGRLSIGMAVSASLGITAIGVVLGLLAGLYGRATETVIMRLVDVLLSLPTLILALVVVGLLGQGLRNLIVTVILVQWPRYARLVRGMTLEVRERDYVQAARSAGASRLHIMVRHVAPNLIGPVVVFSTIDMGQTLLSVSSLSFLGFGVAPPTPEWGAMLSEARHFIDRGPHLLLFPGLAITLLVLAFNLAGDGLRDLLDPRTAEAASLWDRRRPRRRGRARRRWPSNRSSRKGVRHSRSKSN